MAKRNMAKVNRMHASKFMVFVVYSLFIIAYFVPVGTILAAQPNDEWVAEPMHITQLSGASDPPGYSPTQIREAYGLSSSGGAGATIAIIDAYNTTTIWNDLTVFSANFSLPLPSARFNATVLVPTTTAGQHTLTINDGASNFCVNLTRLPTVTNDYANSWHTTDFTINLTPDYNVNETFYSINNGPICNVTSNRQPVITTEGSNNTLEYWSTWDIYGTGTMELPHVTLIGIQLEKTAPGGTIQINNGATSTSSNNVTLTVNATDSLSGISQMRFSNDGVWDQISWEPFTNIKNWQLTNGDGVKSARVYCQIKDNAGLIANLSSSIILSTPQPSPSPSPSATSSPSFTQSPSFTPTTSPAPSESPSPEPSATPEVPELSIQMILVLFAVSTLSLAVKYKRKARANSTTLVKKRKLLLLIRF